MCGLTVELKVLQHQSEMNESLRCITSKCLSVRGVTMPLHGSGEFRSFSFISHNVVTVVVIGFVSPSRQSTHVFCRPVFGHFTLSKALLAVSIYSARELSNDS